MKGRLETGDEAQLVKGIQEKDPQAIRIVVHRYLGQLLRAARAGGFDRSDTEESVGSLYRLCFEGRRVSGTGEDPDLAVGDL